MRFYVMQRISMTAVFFANYRICFVSFAFILYTYVFIYISHTPFINSIPPLKANSFTYYIRIKYDSDMQLINLFNSDSQIPQFQFNQQSLFRTFIKLSFKYIPSCFSKMCMYFRQLIFGICYLFFSVYSFSLCILVTVIF